MQREGPTETDLSHYLFIAFKYAQALPTAAEEDHELSEGVDHFSGSNSSFLANEKLMSVDSMNSDITGMSICYFSVSEFYPCIILGA